MTLDQILNRIDQGDPPPFILVGGNSEFLVDRAFGQIRDRILARHRTTQLEPYPETADLAMILDSFRTMSLFHAKRLLVLPEVNAFVTRKEVADLLSKALEDWSSAKTERKRSSSTAKLLHLLGLVGEDLDSDDSSIAISLGLKGTPDALTQMLEFARSTGRHATRGEADAALLAEAASRGGAPGATLLMKTGELPRDSATIALLDRAGAVVACDLTREQVPVALDEALSQIATECRVRFDRKSVDRLRERLGIDRILGDKYSREIPDLRLAISEAERIATFVGQGGIVTPEVIEQQITAVSGGMRYELASLFAEGKAVEAVAKLRDLVSQSKREDPRTSVDIHFGKFLFPLADEIRQMLAIRSFARLREIELQKPVPFPRFRDSLAEPLGEFLKEQGLVRQRPHPFALHRKFEAARLHRDEELWSALHELAEIDFRRKSGGISAELGLEALIFSLGK
jgi:DNA polymerase III delta subunit